MFKTAETAIFGLCAPSASGKTWVMHQLVQRGIVRGWPSHTTRAPRPGEVSTGYDHVFVDPETFMGLKEAGEFVIDATFYGHQYGLTQPQEDGTSPLMVLIKPEIIKDFNITFGERAVVLGIHSADGARTAEHRMQARGQGPLDIEQRLAAYETEIAMARALIPEEQYFVAPDHPGGVLPALVDEIRRHT